MYLKKESGTSTSDNLPATLTTYSSERMKVILRNRLYVVLALIAGLFIADHTVTDIHSQILQTDGIHFICAAITAVFLYTVLPMARSFYEEVKYRKIGLAAAIMVIIIASYLFSLNEFLAEKDLDSVIEFSILLLTALVCQYIIEIKNIQSEATISNQKREIDIVLNSIDEVVWSIDANTHDILYVNVACFSVFGYRPDEMLSDKNTFFGSIHIDDRTKFYEHMEEVTTLGHTVCDIRVLHKNGEIRYLHAKGKLLYDKQRKTNVVSGITQDVTNETLAEIERQKKARELENVLNSINDGFFAIDKDFKLTFVNKIFQAIYGNNTIELIGQSFWEVAHIAIQKDFFNQCVLAMSAGVDVSFEEYCTILEKWFLYKVYPTANGASIYFTDITDQKKMLQRISDDKKKLEGQNSVLSEIAWIQSHKVRAPLANIMGLMPLLNYNDPTDQDNAIILDGIKTASEKLDQVIREISEKTHTISQGEQYEKQYRMLPLAVRI